MEMFERVDKLKLELDELRPIEQKHMPDIKAFWSIDLAYSSNALEGNTLTQSETRVLILDGITIGGKKVSEVQEAIGHGHAFDFMMEVFKSGYDLETIKELHRLFFTGIDPNNAGQYRRENVMITGSDFVPVDHGQVGEAMSNIISSIKEKCRHPIEEAARAHLELVHIHPFIDGNGRTARLLMNLILVKSGFPIAIIPPIYRGEYITCCQSFHEGNIQPFNAFLAKVVEQSLVDYIRMLKKLK